MADDDNLDQSDYGTPQSLNFQRLYAKALLEQGLGPIPGKAVSPFQALGGILSTIAGQNMLQNARQQELGTMAAGAHNMPTTPGEGSGGPLSTPAPTSAPSGPLGFTDPISKYAAVTAKQEGDGSYDQLGPVTKTGDRAYGKYQVMGNNIPEWTSQVLGKTMTPSQFLNDPQAQEDVYRAKFGEYVNKYGPEGAARAWFAGEHGMNNPAAHDVNGTTVADYGKDFVSKALAFSGQPSGGPSSDAGGPLSQSPNATGPLALAPRVEAPGGIPTPSMAPAMRVAGQGGTPVGAIPLRPQVSRQQFEALMANPLVPQSTKDSVAGMYYGQNQPVSAPGMGGNYIIDPTGRTPPRFVPDIVNVPVKAGDVEIQSRRYYDPSTGTYHVIGVQGAGGATPGGPVAPPSSGGPPEAGPTDLTPPPAAPAAPAATKALPFAGEPQANQSEMPPIISQGPEGMLAAKSPVSFKPASFADTSTGGTTAAPGVRVAQTTPDLESMTPAELADWSQRRAVNTETMKQFNVKDIEDYNKKYSDYQTSSTKALNLKNQIDFANKIVHDPEFIQGPLSNYKQAWNDVLTAFGNKNAEYRTTLSNALSKTVSGTILGDMRTQLQGLGQVRLAEIDLLKRAAAAQGNTLGANQAILELQGKAMDQMTHIGQLTNWYREGYRWGDDGKLIRNAQGQPIKFGDRPTEAGQDKVVRTYLLQNPLLTNDQIENYNKMFDYDEKGKPVQAATTAPAPPPNFVKKQ